MAMWRQRSFVRNHAWLLISLLFVLAYGIIYAIEANNFPSNGDFAIMAEVARRVAHGAKLYVEAIDQKGPVLYLWWARMWRMCGSYRSFFTVMCVVEWAFRAASTLLVCRVFHEEGRDEFGAMAAGLLLVLGYGSIGKAEMYVMPFVLYALLVVRREIRGTRGTIAQYGVVGLGAAFTAMTKWPACLMFALVAAYGIGTRHWRAVLRGVGIAAVSALMSVAALLVWSLSYTDVFSMCEQYLGASGTGYVANIVLSSLSGVAVIVWLKFFLFATLSVVSLVIVHMHLARRSLWWVFGGFSLLMASLTLAISYYCIFSLPVIFVGLVEVSSAPTYRSRRRHAEGIEADVSVPYVCAAMSVVLIYALMIGISMPSTDEDATVVKSIVGDCDSVMCTYFVSLDILSRMGLVSPYAQPAPNNVAGTDAEVRRDIADGRWRYVLMPMSKSMRNLGVGDKTRYLGHAWCVRFVSDHAVLLEQMDVTGALMHCGRYEAF